VRLFVKTTKNEVKIQYSPKLHIAYVTHLTIQIKMFKIKKEQFKYPHMIMFLNQSIIFSSLYLTTENLHTAFQEHMGKGRATKESRDSKLRLSKESEVSRRQQ